jgi:hypothetical protein
MLHLLVWVISPEVRSPIYTLNRIGHSGPLEAAGFGVETEVPSNMEANGRFDQAPFEPSFASFVAPYTSKG